MLWHTSGNHRENRYENDLCELTMGQENRYENDLCELTMGQE